MILRNSFFLKDLLASKGYIRGPFGSALKRGEMLEAGVPVYEQSNAINNDRIFRYFISKEKFESLARFSVQPGDLILSCSGTVGEVTLISEGDPIGIISQALLILRPDTRKVLPKYLLYFFKTKKGRNSILERSSGSVQVNIAKREVIESIEISIPSIDDQKRIVKILDDIDKRIENNLSINKNLESQAIAIYKSWFVDYEPFGGKKPTNWNSGKLKDILQLKKKSIKPGEGTDLPYLPIDAIPTKSLALSELRPNDEAQSSLLLFNKNDILIGAMRVYFHRVCLSPCDGITRTTCFVLKPYQKDYLYYSLITCCLDKSIEFAQKTSKGTTMPYAVWNGGLGEMNIEIPSAKIAKKYGEIVEPLITKIQGSFYENNNLLKLRNTLLEKLLLGKIDVSKINLGD